MSNTGDDIVRILTERLTTLRDSVSDNIRNSGQWSSGLTAQSMRLDVDTSHGILWGRENFGNLESGISPKEASAIPISLLASRIYWWSRDKGIDFKDESKRDNFVDRVVENLRTNGSWLFKNGGREDIITPAIDKCIEGLADEIGEVIVERLTILRDEDN